MPALINGSLLRDLRVQRRLSQQQLAEISKVGIATIKRIERCQGVYKSQSVPAERLARALEVHVSDLSEESFRKVVDLGSDVEMILERQISIEEMRQGFEKLLAIASIKNRFVGSK